ncbi:uncharacterized protein LOC128671890 [Plodia interpunctella]|uniref:uncharacterized protein LOC128671890 n=1 Tax=Plodia interpunctella TaxID=58824 RepID=UPI002367CEC6|nr:uncharacterized protein LOC128671890 [Plodia interpunctella]
MKSVLFYLLLYNLFYVYNCLEKQKLEDTTMGTDFDDDYRDATNRPSTKVPGHKLTCLTCNNVDTRACSRPSQKFLYTEKCKRTTDRCLSIHTPFGIVTRGCYDISRKQVLYFCAADLCNNIPVRDVLRRLNMGNKKKWVQDVADLSHARRLRHTTKKGLKCLSCSVSSDDSKSPELKSACWEGTASFRFGISTEVCQEKDVCGIRVMKFSGSVVRGCCEVSSGLEIFSFTYTNPVGILAADSRILVLLCENGLVRYLPKINGRLINTRDYILKNTFWI